MPGARWERVVRYGVEQVRIAVMKIILYGGVTWLACSYLGVSEDAISILESLFKVIREYFQKHVEPIMQR